MNKRSTRY